MRQLALVAVAHMHFALLLLLFAWSYFSLPVFWGRWWVPHRWLPEAAVAIADDAWGNAGEEKGIVPGWRRILRRGCW